MTLDELRELSENATPGPWDSSAYGEWLTNDKHQRFLILRESGGNSPRWDYDARFIAACVNYVREQLATQDPIGREVAG